MKCILYLIIALLSFGKLYSQEVYQDYDFYNENWDAKTKNENSDGGTTTVNGVVTRINGTNYTHTSNIFRVGNQGTGWITQFNEFF